MMLVNLVNNYFHQDFGNFLYCSEFSIETYIALLGGGKRNWLLLAEEDICGMIGEKVHNLLVSFLTRCMWPTFE